MSWRFKASKYKNAAPKVPKPDEWVRDLNIGSYQINGQVIKASASFMAFNADVAGQVQLSYRQVNKTDMTLPTYRKQFVRHSIKRHRKKAQKLSTPSCPFWFSHRFGFFPFWWWSTGYRVPRFHGISSVWNLFNISVSNFTCVCLILKRSNYGAFQSVDCPRPWRHPSVHSLGLINVE